LSLNYRLKIAIETASWRILLEKLIVAELLQGFLDVLEPH
jgi:hypothetical protein